MVHKRYKHIIMSVLMALHCTVTSGSDSKAGPTLAPGDIVEVCEGQLMHLQDKVINVEGDVVTIMPKHEDLKVAILYIYVLYSGKGLADGSSQIVIIKRMALVWFYVVCMCFFYITLKCTD